MKAQRRLAAIMAVDGVGFSRLVEADERGTYERLEALRLTVAEPAIAGHGGRILKPMGGPAGRVRQRRPKRCPKRR
ncbi:hypothetical protein [Marinimicrococcus flavescens]|uniref:Uncharacterized protein n=1 Tax=Marinimicrococcus flavescens TaxID=3031815 RepID=A0AAP4D7I6_9PROT|nr:hypothetical protein [Marinimicrococcus flavescens]